MATLYREQNGCARVQVFIDGKRRSIRLGTVSDRDAERTREKIAELAAWVRLGRPFNARLMEWVEGVDDVLHERIAASGLVESRTKRRRPTIREAITEHAEFRKDVKPTTRANWKQGHDSLAEFVGDGRRLDAITATDAEAWRQSMIAAKLAEATIRKRVKVCKTLFAWAKRRGYVERSPLDALASSSPPGTQKPYVSEADALRVMDKLPDHRWRLLFALGRFGGLRLPSEALALRWSDVDWEHSIIRVPVPKLAHLPGKGERRIPMFIALRPYLLTAFEEAKPGDERVVAIVGYTDAWLRKVIRQAIVAAGLTPWRQLLHALRASCETDLFRVHPAAAVCRWIGHELKVAERHYLQVTDADFARAAGLNAPGVHGHACKAVQNPVQRRTANGCTEAHDPRLQAANSGVQSDAVNEWPGWDSNPGPTA